MAAEQGERVPSEAAVEQGQIWKRIGGKARYEIYSVTRGVFSALDAAEGFGAEGEQYVKVLAEPLHGGKPILATLTAFQERYEAAETP